MKPWLSRRALPTTAEPAQCDLQPTSEPNRVSIRHFPKGPGEMASPNWVAKRKAIIAKIEKSRKSKVILYVTGDRRGMETQVHPEVIDFCRTP